MTATLRQALRSLLQARAFSLTVIATLAIGIGLNAAIFTVVDTVLLRPLGYRDADRIVALETRFNDEGRSIPRLGGDDYNDLAREIKSLDAVAYYQGGDDGLRLGPNTVYTQLALVSPPFMKVMGVEPVAGRLFHPGDAKGDDVLVGESFAAAHFGSATAAVGQVVFYGGKLRPVVGVLPAGFAFPNRAQVWVEQDARPDVDARSSYNQRAVGRRAAGASAGVLTAELASFSSQLQHAYVEDANKSVVAVSLQHELVKNVRSSLYLMMGAVGVILLIVCVNVTHLQLVRAARAQHAVSIRTALGASRARLAARSLAEAALLACAGCLCALALAFAALHVILRLAPEQTPRLADIRLNADVFLFSFAISLVVMSITALLPIWRAWHVDPASALRQDASRGTEGRSAARLRSGFIVAEVALTLALAVSAALLSRQLILQSKADLGFTADNLLVLDTHAIDTTPQQIFVGAENFKPAAIAAAKDKGLRNMARLDAALDVVRGTPGVLSAAAADGVPTFGSSNVGFAIKGVSTFGNSKAKLPIADFRPATPGLLDTLGVPLLRGRMLTEADGPDAPPVVLIDETLARTVFHGEDPLGKQIMNGYDATTDWTTIVGIVGNVRSSSPAEDPVSAFYVPLAQHPRAAPDAQIVVRTALSPAAVLETLRTRLRQSHPEIAIKGSTMRESIGLSQQAEQFRATLFGLFAAVSILLAAIGMYGVTAYTVAQRRFEFGLRFALGADRAQVLLMVLRQALAVAALGVAVGLALSFALTHVLASVVGRLPQFDVLSYAAAALAVLFTALLATFVPARRAAAADPMTILRNE